VSVSSCQIAHLATFVIAYEFILGIRPVTAALRKA
jgi:hypothetical protein